MLKEILLKCKEAGHEIRFCARMIWIFGPAGCCAVRGRHYVRKKQRRMRTERRFSFCGRSFLFRGCGDRRFAGIRNFPSGNVQRLSVTGSARPMIWHFYGSKRASCFGKSGCPDSKTTTFSSPGSGVLSASAARGRKTGRRDDSGDVRMHDVDRRDVIDTHVLWADECPVRVLGVPGKR